MEDPINAVDSVSAISAVDAVSAISESVVDQAIKETTTSYQIDAANRLNAMKNHKIVPNSALIRIRSGDGQLHIITKSLLDQSPYFNAVLSQRWTFPNPNDEIEVCCSSESFTNLLNVLRYGQEAARDLNSSQRFMLLMDANYFGFPAVMFNKIQGNTQIARPCRKLEPIKVKAPVYYK